MKQAGCMVMTGVLLLVLCGCHRYQPVSSGVEDDGGLVSSFEIIVETETESEPAEVTPPEPEERAEQDGKIQSYLTGEMVDVSQANRRPVAVMLSNDKQALPQYGINRAGVVYEAPVEGGMNRYMALIEDFDGLERIGSVRSCRTYYTYFAKEFDAFYAHFGQSTFAKPYLKSVDNINGIEGIGEAAYYRSKDKKAPHNAYTSGTGLLKAVEQLGYTKEYGNGYQGHYQFAASDQKINSVDAIEALTVYPGYEMNHPYFEYHEDEGLYYRYQYGALHMGDEGEIKVKNIIIQSCLTGTYSSTEYLDINVHSGNPGYFITNGQAIPIQWQKDGEFGVTHYYDMENKEIILNKGKTWVCIVPVRDLLKIQIHGKN